MRRRLIRGAAFFAFAGAVLYLGVSGGLGTIIHPRTQAWVYVAALLAAFLGLVELRAYTSMAPRVPGAVGALLLVLAASVLFATLPQSAATTSLDPSVAAGQARARDGAAADAAIASGAVALEGEAFLPLYGRLFDDPARARGLAITAVGYVYHRRDLPEGSFIVARNLMWCCSADLGTVGLVVLAPGQGALPEAAWVRVRGTVEVGPFDMAGDGEVLPVPQIRASSLERVEAPADPTLYPR